MNIAYIKYISGIVTNMIFKTMVYDMYKMDFGIWFIEPSTELTQ